MYYPVQGASNRTIQKCAAVCAPRHAHCSVQTHIQSLLQTHIIRITTFKNVRTSKPPIVIPKQVRTSRSSGQQRHSNPNPQNKQHTPTSLENSTVALRDSVFLTTGELVVCPQTCSVCEEAWTRTASESRRRELGKRPGCGHPPPPARGRPPAAPRTAACPRALGRRIPAVFPTLDSVFPGPATGNLAQVCTTANRE